MANKPESRPGVLPSLEPARHMNASAAGGDGVTTQALADIQDLEENALHRVWTAYREAGHAIAYILEGLTFRYVTMRPRGDALGKVQVHPRLRDATSLAVATLAGPLAERAGLWAMDDEGSSFDRWLETCSAVGGAMADAQAPENRRERIEGGLAMEFSSPLLWARHGEVVTAEEMLPRHIAKDDAVRWATATVLDNWVCIDALAAVLLESRRAITYAECLAIVGPFRDAAGRPASSP